MKMEKGINLATLEFKQNLASVINESGLPICIVQMVLNELQTQISIQSRQIIKAETEEYEMGDESDGKEICKAELAE